MANFSTSDKNGFDLNIMPLLDVFSILILFLLMNYSSDPIQVDLDKRIILPKSWTTASLDELPALIIEPDLVKINEMPIISTSAVNQEQASLRGLQSIYSPLSKLYSTTKKIHQEKQIKGPISLTIEADKSTGMLTLKRIMKISNNAEFIQFKLMVEKETL